MKDTPFTKAVDEVIELKMKAIDAYIEEIIEPIEHVGNPEQLIRKPYGEWTPEDLQMLQFVYGSGDDTPLARLIFNKSYQEVQDLEKEEPNVG